MRKLLNTLDSLRKLTSGESLSCDETVKLFKTIFLYDKKGYFFTAATSAIHAKKETPEELAGIVDVLKELAPNIEIDEEITDTSGTGGGDFKSINVSTAVAFIMASFDIKVAKASYYGVTSKCGSADVLKHYQIDISKLDNKQKIKKVLEKTGIVFYYTPFFSRKLENRGKLFKKVFIENNLRIKTPFHLTTNVFSPFSIKRRIYGVYDKRYLKDLAKMFSLLGFEKTFTFSAEIGLPEISLSGKTYVVQQKGNFIKEIIWTPKDFGLKEVAPEEISFRNLKHSLMKFKEILQGKDDSPYAQLVWMNASAVFYLFGKVRSLQEGVKLAQKICKSQKPWQLLEEVKNVMKDL